MNALLVQAMAMTRADDIVEVDLTIVRIELRFKMIWMSWQYSCVCNKGTNKFQNVAAGLG